MSDAEIKSLMLIAFVVMLVIVVRALWGKRSPRPSAKNGCRRTEESRAGRWFDDQGAGGDPVTGGAD